MQLSLVQNGKGAEEGCDCGENGGINSKAQQRRSKTPQAEHHDLDPGSSPKPVSDCQVNVSDINNKSFQKCLGPADHLHLGVPGKMVLNEMPKSQLADVIHKALNLLDLYDAIEAARPNSTKTVD